MQTNVLTEFAIDSVFEDVRAERHRQDNKWGGAAHDDAHDATDWFTFIGDRNRTAVCAHSIAGDSVAYRRRLIQVAALAVAAVESLDRKS